MRHTPPLTSKQDIAAARRRINARAAARRQERDAVDADYRHRGRCRIPDCAKCARFDAAAGDGANAAFGANP